MVFYIYLYTKIRARCNATLGIKKIVPESASKQL
ncbi:hypothetical protein EV131_11332 [Rhizobium laguerreae]|uniref:Uncharacterized protein n=1 Tax=Rhizobium laguerreae TaxID=1076926 RepID=A0AAX2QEG8_9HYPH|nr:hypothetical protein EV131_11332 [Rhizobium laguerreae]